MKITSKEARQLIEFYRKKTENDMWIDHCLCVGDSAGKIAKALNEKGYNIDIDKVITLGYLHDIGKYNGESHGHVMRGYNYLKDKGYDEEYCDICLTHSYLNNDIICTVGRDAYSNTQYHIKETYKLKTYFDNLLGYNLYDLFPEIKENL